MKKGIQTKHEIQAPITAVWDLIKTGEQWEDWLSILVGSNVIGNTRTCNVPTPDGKQDIFEETFLASNLERIFIYQINKQQSFPAADLIGCIKLQEDGNKTIMYWSIEMSVESEDIFDELKTQIEHVYAEGVKKLEELANTLS